MEEKEMLIIIEKNIKKLINKNNYKDELIYEFAYLEAFIREIDNMKLTLRRLKIKKIMEKINGRTDC
jgi:hypothetical protein